MTPENFNGLNADTSPDVRVPASADRLLIQPDPALTAAARPLFGQIFARLRPGVPFERADARVDAALEQAYQDETARIFPGSKQVPSSSRLRLQSIANGVSNLRTQFAPSLQVLMGGVALLLLMACVNVAGLLLARSAVRAQEFTVRRALGASSWRIVRQLLTEGLLLAIPGGIGGTLLAAGCLPLLMRAMPPQRDRAAVLQPLAVHVTLDGRVLAFTALVALATAILFALSPALRAAGGATRTTSARSLGRNLIVSAQVALCTVILIGAALLIATLEHMRTMNIGFDRDHVVTFTIDPGIRNYKPEAARALSKTLLEKVRALPGVDGAAIASRAVMRGTGVKATLQAAGARVTPADFLNASLNEVTPAYFETMDMHILAGRDFNAFDRNKTAPRQVIVNQSFARRFFPGRDPIGQRFGYAGPGGLAKPDDEIVGVVTDAKYRSVREPVPPTVYTSADGFDSSFILHVRTHEHPEAMIAPVGESLRALDAEMPVIEARTLREEVETSLWQERLLAWLSTVFGAIAALLASIGLYGALDYAVKSRTREIGIRVAIGAPPSRIMAMLARETGAFIAAGALLGVLAYAAAAVWIRRVLYEVGAWEPAAVVSVLGLIAIIAAIALAPPILRAMRINPGSALRAE